MKNLLKFSLFILAVTVAPAAFSQNIMINVLTRNSGLVKKGAVAFLEVTINNTNPTTDLPMYKIRPQISFPTSLVSIPETGHVLPEGWTIAVNKNAVVTLSNGTDMIPANTGRTILIAVKGENSGGPSTINGNVFFSNGVAPGTASGTATKNDNPADNFSTSTIKVTP